MMVPDQYNALERMILDHMVCVGVALASDNATKNSSGEDRAEKNHQQETNGTHDGIGLAFERLYDDGDKMTMRMILEHIVLLLRTIFESGAKPSLRHTNLLISK